MSANTTFFSKRSMASILWLLVSKVFTFLIYFSISVIVVRKLTPEEYGSLSIYKSIVSYMVILCGLGLNISILRFIPELVSTHNFSGLRNLLSKAVIVQFIGLILGGFGILLLQNTISNWFKLDFNSYSPVILFLVMCFLAKGFVNDSLTAFFKLKNVAFISSLQAAVWILLVASLLYGGLAIKGVLIAEAISYLIVSAIGAFYLVKHVRGLNLRSPSYGIGKRRVILLSLPTWLNNMMLQFMMQYTEIFFIGYFFTPVLAGQYELGFSTTFLVITFIPMTVHTVFVSAFAEAYSKDKSSLPQLVSGMFQILILITVPISCFGLFNASEAVAMFYGSDMAAAGPIAAAFSLIHILPMINVPLSMAITAKELNLSTLWLQFVQVVTNLILDFLLIRSFGVYGAIGAVAGTFVITLPIKLLVIRGLIGGIYFPMMFFLRVFIPSFLIAGLVSMNISGDTIPSLICAGIGYVTLYFAIMKYGRLIRRSDTEKFRAIGLPKLNRFFDMITA